MTKIHWKQEIQYLNAVADYIQSLGYDVEEPDPKHRDLLDVWGKVNGRKCFTEIYVTIHKLDNGLVGYWMQGDNESEEVYFDTTFGRGLDTRFFPLCILENLEPIYKKAV